MAEIVSAGPFATEGERRAAARLQTLPDQWLVICNKMLVTSDGRTYEIDFIVVGERWVFVIDEKSWRGPITGNDQRWIRSDGFSERSPLSKADTIARPLAGHLRAGCARLRENQGQWVRGGVLLSLSDQLPAVQDPRVMDGVFLFPSVCERLQEIDRKGGSRNIGEARDEIHACLLGLSARPDAPERIGLYHINEVVSAREGTRVFHATMEGGGARLLSVYDLGRDPIQPQRLHDFYLREYSALQQLRPTGLVPEVQDPFVWSDDFLVVPLTPPAGQPLGVCALPETRDDFVNELQLTSDAFASLHRIHESGVVHRAISPESVYVALGGTNLRRVIFTNFHAARMDEGRTIIVSLDALTIDDPYAPTELVAGYGNASPASDVFSLALTFLERAARLPVMELRQATDGTVAVPNLASHWPSLPEDAISELESIFNALLQPEAADRMSASAAAASFGDLVRRLRVEARVDRSGELDGRYTVLKLLGQGAMARTYLVRDKDFDGSFAIKQFRQPSLVYDQARAEFSALRELSSRYLPRIFDVYPPEKDAHVKMEYIPGPTLEQLRPEFPWDVDRWWRLAQNLLSALDVLEERRLLHRDVKPANIILHESDGRAVLIDFGLAVSRGAETRPAGTPRYLPPEAIMASEPPPTCDRYATAVVLFAVLTGAMPFEPGTGSDARMVNIPGTIQDEKVRRLARVLSRAMSNDPDQRPPTAAAMRTEIMAAMLAIEEPLGITELPELVNPWVDRVRGLYRNSGVGNADNRGLDSTFVRDTYVPTRLDDRLLPEIFLSRPSAVFLSGNPGDGKTAFLEQFQGELRRRGAVEVQRDASGWEWDLDGHVFRSCYDASEANQGQSADEQLIGKLRGLEGPTTPTLALSVLVAINDGRLVDFFDRHSVQFRWLTRQVAGTRGRSFSPSSPVWQIDLKRRAFLTLSSDDESVASRVLGRLVQADDWAICEGCAAHAVCPMRNNAAALRDDNITERLEHLLLLTHLRRKRHTTMRDLRSAMSFLVTANISCVEVHATRHGELPDERSTTSALVDLAYWRSAFAPVDAGDELLNDLQPLDPARLANPQIDRFLHFHRGSGDASTRQALFARGEDLAPQRFADEAAWMAAMKRRQYFESPAPPAELRDGAIPIVNWYHLLPYQHAAHFLDLLAGTGDLDAALERIALGIFRSDGYTSQTQRRQLYLRVTASSKQQLVVLKQFPLEEFRLSVLPPAGGDAVESIPEGLQLAHQSGTPQLVITLDLFELLMQLADGLQPEAPEFQPLLEDLAAFKSTLLLRQTTDLVLLEASGREHRLTQRGGTIVRITPDDGPLSEAHK